MSSSGKMDSRTSLSSCWSSTPMANARSYGRDTEPSFGGEVAPHVSARTTEILRGTRNFWANSFAKHIHLE
jgi:hypothetical protein